MAYTPTDWKNREVENPRTFQLQSNPNGTTTLLPKEGNVIEAGTPIIADNMNKIEQGIKDAHDGLAGIGNVTQELAAHKAEDAIHLAGGTANAITVNTGGNYSYGQFKQLKIKAVANNTGNLTINVDGQGTKPALKFDGTQLAAGALKKDKVYDWYYDTASGGRFFLIAKASGTAVVGDVLAGKPFSNDDGEQIGTMIDRGAMVFTPSVSQQTIPAGYHNGGGRVNAGALKANGTGNLVNGLLNISGIGFTPTEVYVELFPGQFNPNRVSYIQGASANINETVFYRNADNNTQGGVRITNSTWAIGPGTASINLFQAVASSNALFKWTAVA